MRQGTKEGLEREARKRERDRILCGAKDDIAEVEGEKDGGRNEGSRDGEMKTDVYEKRRKKNGMRTGSRKLENKKWGEYKEEQTMSDKSDGYREEKMSA